MLDGAAHATAALLILAALSLIGFALLPPRLRARARLAFPAALALGSLLVGWSSWLIGTFIGTHVLVGYFVLLMLMSAVRGRAWAISAGRWFTLFGRIARSNVLAACALAAIVLLTLPPLLLPLADSDGIAYHVALPKLFYMTGHVSFLPWTVVSALPQTMEMINLLALRIAGGETAKFLHFGYFAMSLMTLAMTMPRSPRARVAALLAPILYAAAPVVLAPAGAAFVDHASTFFIATGALLLFRGGPPVFAGCALGAAVATKITAFPAAGGLLLFALLKGRMRTFAAAAIPVCIAFLPFAVRNMRHTGDPIYPVGYVLLKQPVPGIAADRIAYGAYFHSSVPGPLGIGWTPAAGVQTDEVAGLHHVFGLFALLVMLRYPSTRRWLALILPYLAVALLFRPPTRYLLPMFYGLAAVEAYAVAILARRWATLVAIVAAIPAFVASADFTLHWGAPFDYILGRIDRETFLATRIPGYRAALFINAQPEGGSVMALDFPAPYYFDRPFVVEGILNEPPLRDWLRESKNAGELLSRLRAMNVRYIVVTPGYGGGTNASLLPLARDRREAMILADLRRRLTFLKRIDGADVVRVP